MTERLYDLKEAAEQLGISRGRIWDLFYKGQLKSSVTPGHTGPSMKTVRFTQADLDRRKAEKAENARRSAQHNTFFPRSKVRLPYP